MDERVALLALHLTPGIGGRTLRQLVSYCGSAVSVFETQRGKLDRIPGIGPVTIQSLIDNRLFDQAEKEFRKAEREKVTIIFYTDGGFPQRLKATEDAPAVVYVKGQPEFENKKVVGIVGTRQATSYGREVTDQLVRDLVPHAALVVSGLAYGIDIHAHKCALKNGLPTVGVMASGLDIIYPASHKDTARSMLKDGGWITENPFGTKPDAPRFPARNRIIAGLCDALVVVEAAEKGGALITADIANSYNRDVFAVPGNLGQTHSGGCNKLIKANKANLIMSVKDLEYIMGWDKQVKPTPLPLELFNDLAPEEKTITDLLKEKGGPAMIDEISWKTRLSQGVLAGILLQLELKGHVISLPGKMYRLAGRRS
jgi:DNA processing protein